MAQPQAGSGEAAGPRGQEKSQRAHSHVGNTIRSSGHPKGKAHPAKKSPVEGERRDLTPK